MSLYSNKLWPMEADCVNQTCCSLSWAHESTESLSTNWSISSWLSWFCRETETSWRRFTSSWHYDNHSNGSWFLQFHLNLCGIDFMVNWLFSVAKVALVWKKSKSWKCTGFEITWKDESYQLLFVCGFRLPTVGQIKDFRAGAKLKIWSKSE